jgi:hypothetical protein
MATANYDHIKTLRKLHGNVRNNSKGANDTAKAVYRSPIKA